MGQKSRYLQKKVLDAVFGNTALPAWATLYFALFEIAPTTVSDVGIEITGGSYARVAKTNNPTNFPAAIDNGDNYRKYNGTEIVFPTATADWGNTRGFGIYDAAAAGNLLYWGNLTPTTIILSGRTVRFKVPAPVTILDGLSITER